MNVTSTTFRRALKEAERELVRLTAKREEIDLAIIRTRQTVLTLRMQVDGDAGYTTVQPRTLTEAAEWVLLGSRTPLDAPTIRDRIVALPFEIKASNPLASVHSVLKRLIEQGLAKEAYQVRDDGALLWYSRAYWSERIGKLPSGWVLPTNEEIDRQWAEHLASIELGGATKKGPKGRAKK